jgi:hypothetical protein
MKSDISKLKQFDNTAHICIDPTAVRNGSVEEDDSQNGELFQQKVPGIGHDQVDHDRISKL